MAGYSFGDSVVLDVKTFLGKIDKAGEILVFVDGACSGNPGPGGWGAIAKQGEACTEISGGEIDTTNNRMELSAAINALRALDGCSVINVTTDSQYLKNGIESWLAGWKKNGWKTSSKQPVKNQDLWQQLDELCSGPQVSWCWVRGHNGHIYNERADALAQQAVIKMIVH
jgi:ribonuclease HI